MKTYYFGVDCFGFTLHAVTVEGICIYNMYAQPLEAQYFNQKTKTRGDVQRGKDGELHFTEYR